jgi:hypothetical protein
MKIWKKTHLRTETGIIGRMKYEKSYWLTKETSGDLHYYVITEHENDRGMTDNSLELLKKVQEHRLLGDFKYAYMSTDTNTGRGHLVLVDVDDNELHLSGCGAGYTGTGAQGTLEILKKLGFEIDLMNRVFRNATFNLKHPKHGMYIDQEPFYTKRQ